MKTRPPYHVACAAVSVPFAEMRPRRGLRRYGDTGKKTGFGCRSSLSANGCGPWSGLTGTLARPERLVAPD